MSEAPRTAAAVVVVALGLVVLGSWGSAAAQAAAPRIARPNPVLVAVHLDYVGPIPGPSGAAATLAPLNPAVIAQAVADRQFLAFSSVDDLGGFAPAPAGRLAILGGGHNLVGGQVGTSQIPQFAQAAGGTINSFAAVEAPATPPDQGLQPVPGLGTPPPVTPPTNSNFVPPPNQGFGGTPTPKPPPATTTTPTTRPTPTTPTTPTTTTAPTTTAPAPPPPTTTPTPPPFVGASCGTAGLTITSDHSTCQINAVNMAPGDAASEVMTIRNDSGQPFTLSLRADGTVNTLWNWLQLGVWEAGTAAPSLLPALLWWTTQNNTLTTLQPGESIRYELELYLPTAAGNSTQGLTASIDLIWKAQG